MAEHGACAPSPPSGGEGRGEGAPPRVTSGVVALLKLSAPHPDPLPASAGRGRAGAVPPTRALSRQRAIRRFKLTLLLPLIALFLVVLVPVLLLSFISRFTSGRSISARG